MWKPLKMMTLQKINQSVISVYSISSFLIPMLTCDGVWLSDFLSTPRTKYCCIMNTYCKMLIYLKYQAIVFQSHPKYTDIFWPYSLFHIWLTKPCYYYCTTVKICRLRGKGIIWKLQIIVLCRVFYSQEQCIGTHIKWQCKKGLHIHHSLRTIYVRLWKKFEARDYADIISLIMQLIWDFFPSECLVL